ncbi:glycosyltransferase family 2 protein [Demequina sp. NBRC 110055]|uniref:glycosyltransferase family 2 protein n=1 Tax=Demequina sp. NBRC 110055 TaxID=1570344 RepID=UPI000A02C18F|nr:cellulose synthase catalytic subunit [Demequina sp. NBRC 110055]
MSAPTSPFAPAPARRSLPDIEPGTTPSPLMFLTVGAAAIGTLAYAAFLLNPAHRGDWLPYGMVLVAEFVLVAQAFVAMWTILSGGHNPRDFAYYHAKDHLYGPDGAVDGDPRERRLHVDGRPVDIDVLITTCGEDPEVIRRTVRAAVNIHGLHRTWVLDDGRSDAVQALAAEEGARYVRRLTSGGAKAGNVNHALTLAKGDFFVILDADFVPRPHLLEQSVPFFHDPRLAFVQSPQSYDNLRTPIARGAGYMQAVFYRFIQPGRNRYNAAFCVGTNVIFRRAAIDDIDGMSTDSKSEDVWTSLRLHEAGWRSLFIPDVLAVGEAPETIEAYSKQQLRWATGGFEILLTRNPLSRRVRLTGEQRLQYLVTATFYLTGIAPLILLLLPPLEIYLDLRPVTITTTVLTWFLYYAGFYVMQILFAWYTMGSFRWETLTLAAVSFPIYVKAFMNALRRKDVGWQATGTARSSSPYNYVVPQMLFFVFLLLTSAVGVLRDIEDGGVSLATAWCVTNTLILATFLRAARREARGVGADAPAAAMTHGTEPVRTVVARPAEPHHTGEPALARAASPWTPAPATTTHTGRITWRELS